MGYPLDTHQTQELDEHNVEARQNMGELSQLQKHYDRLKRQFRKIQQAKEGVGESLGPLQQENNFEPFSL